MKELIRQAALDLGFDACRFTSAAPPASGERFARWLAEGRHGQMAYLSRQAAKRLDPARVLNQVRTIVTLAASYHRAAPQPPPGPQPTAVIARYARYADYHRVLASRLGPLCTMINQLGGAGTRSLWYVDTGPLLERDLAERAGLGFIGKHTNLISRSLGNWFFLAEVLTTLECAPDTAERNRCGTCTRCLTACPTGAIRAPFQLDARLCISYLTIELRGPIPLELRAAMGARVFGCDDCLAACPWNRFAREGRLMKSRARADLDQPALLELLALDQAQFQARLGDTPIARAKRRGLLRNVCVALGNVGDETCLPALERAAQDPEPLIAEHARWAIDQVRRRLA